MDQRNFPGMFNEPDGPDPSPRDYENYVSLGVVGHDPSDPSEAFAVVVDGQVLVEVTLSGGDSVRAYLCMEETGPNAGGYIPVSPGDSVVLVWPSSNYVGCYIVGRVADLENRLAASCCGLDTYDEATGKLRQFRWIVTRQRVYAVESGREVLVKAGGAGVRIEGAQVLLKGATHLGADFTTAPIPGTVADGQNETPSTAGVPYAPPQGATLTTPPFVGNLNAIVRAKDGVQSCAATDPKFWTWFNAFQVYTAAVDTLLSVIVTLNPALIAPAYTTFQTALGIYAATPKPDAIESQHKGASGTHTCLD